MLEFYSLRDGGDVAELPAVTLESFAGQSNATAVRIEPGEDARELLPFLDRVALVEVNFPVFSDGRGYSAARILREAGYAGELRAVGDVAVDQISHMARCGFDSFAPDKPLDPKLIEEAFSRFPGRYQKTIDPRPAVWAQRHG
jgi:uncharacterized protein (DUF934 family)